MPAHFPKCEFEAVQFYPLKCSDLLNFLMLGHYSFYLICCFASPVSCLDHVEDGQLLDPTVGNGQVVSEKRKF